MSYKFKHKDDRKIVVISAVSLFYGGAFSILKSVLNYLSQDDWSHRYRIIVLVYQKQILNEYSNIELIEFPKARASWLHKLLFEYYYFNKLSKKVKPYLWFSLHDVTPNVKAERRAVYCHNAYPFSPFSFKAYKLEPTFLVFQVFYKLFYRINIHRNNYVIVQQSWFRDEIAKRYKVKKEKIIVNPPSNTITKTAKPPLEVKNFIQIIYPVYPRVFKNYEVICEALLMLTQEERGRFRILFTFDGTENTYSKYIFNQYSYIENIDFVGFQSNKELDILYHSADYLIFPSTLESWGLPISEFKNYNKPIIAAALPYVKEALGNYEKVMFFNPFDANNLAGILRKIIHGNAVFSINKEIEIYQPFAKDWGELFRFLLDE